MFIDLTGVWRWGAEVWGRQSPQKNARELNGASQALPAKAESEPVTWPPAMTESKRISP